MRNLDIVGYGNLLTLDGFRGTSAAMRDMGEASSLLAELGELLDPGSAQRSHGDVADDGISALLISAESQLDLHTFPGVERVSFRVFSRRILPVITLTERVRVRFGLGRVETQLRHRATLVPAEDEVPIAKVLAGQRAYARLRHIEAPTR